MTSILLAGESWVTVQFEIKGRNVLRDSRYGEAADRFVSTLEEIGASVTYQPCHVVTESFPRTKSDLNEYDLVILSDVGADTLQITERSPTATPTSTAVRYSQSGFGTAARSAWSAAT